MTALIIGAGLVGSQVARILVERGERPVLLDFAVQPEALAQIVELSSVDLVTGDVLRPFTLSQAIVEKGVTEIVHTAANPLLTLGAQRDPYSAIQLNIMGTVNVLEAARVHKLRRVVVSSSNVLNHYIAGGLGDDPAQPMKEEAFPRPTTFYSATKQTIENLGLNYARWNDVDFAAMRYGAVAGPWGGRGGGGPSNVFRDMIENALAGREAIIPPSAMEWVYAKDAAMGTVLALKAPELGSRIFNITMGSITTSEDMAAAIRATIPEARTRIEKPSGTGVSLQHMQRISDLTLARDLLGYAPAYDMAASVRDMVAWLKGRK